jgi:hypothetical protein
LIAQKLSVQPSLKEALQALSSAAAVTYANRGLAVVGVGWSPLSGPGLEPVYWTVSNSLSNGQWQESPRSNFEVTVERLQDRHFSLRQVGQPLKARELTTLKRNIRKRLKRDVDAGPVAQLLRGLSIRFTSATSGRRRSYGDVSA